MKQLAIYWRDLNKEARAKVLEFMGLGSESDGNLEIAPLAVLERPTL